MVTIIRRYVETDTGHRVPNHKSKCRHMHGHRYRFEAEIEGDVVDVEGVSEQGMLIDFSDVSQILNEYIHDIIDHAFVVYDKDDFLAYADLTKAKVISWLEDAEKGIDVATTKSGLDAAIELQKTPVEKTFHNPFDEE